MVGSRDFGRPPMTRSSAASGLIRTAPMRPPKRIPTVSLASISGGYWGREEKISRPEGVVTPKERSLPVSSPVRAGGRRGVSLATFSADDLDGGKVGLESEGHLSARGRARGGLP